MRTINNTFINDLKTGELKFFLEQVRQNRDELSLEIRNGYINIYYKGGNLLKITQKKKGYSFHFDEKYCLNKGDDSNYELLKSLPSGDTESFIKHFDTMKQEMDSWFEKHPKAERDFQHALLVNNPCIVDIEYQVGRKLRLDMLMFVDGRLIIVENKYGTGAIGGKSGIKEHYDDICNILATPELYEEMLDSVCHIYAAKKELGLRNYEIKRSDIKDTEIFFLFADYNSKSDSLKNAIETMNETVPAKILMMDKNEHLIDISKAKDLFTYGN